MGKKELVALLGLSSWCLVIVVWLFLTVPWVCLQFVIVVFPDQTHFLFYVIFAPWKLKHLITYFGSAFVYSFFLTNLSTLLQDYNVFIHFNLRNIMLGITKRNEQTKEVQAKNFKILLGKHFIFKNKYKKQHPN